MKDEKLTVKESEWLWAVNRGKQNEYYKSRYGLGTLELTPNIAGGIVGPILRKNSRLLQLAYTYLSMDFSTIYLIGFGLNRDDVQGLKPSYSLFSWMLFLTLGYTLEVSDLSMVVEGNWCARWNQLDAEFGIGKKGEKK